MPGFGSLADDDGGEHGGLAVGGDDGAVGLAGDLARFEHELAPGPDQLFTLDIEHSVVFHGMRMRRRRDATRQDGEGLRCGSGSAGEPLAILPWSSRRLAEGQAATGPWSGRFGNRSEPRGLRTRQV